MADFEITCPSFGDSFNSSPLNNEIKKMPYSFFLDGNIYEYNGKALGEEITDKIKRGNLPGIAPFCVEEFTAFFAGILKTGKDILHIDFSDYYSPDYKYAQAAWRGLQVKFPDRRVHIIDSKRLGLGVCALAIYANELKTSGAPLNDTAAAIKKQIGNNIDLIAVKDFDHLKRKGYVSFLQKKIGLLKGLNPILAFNKEGRLEPLLISKTGKRAADDIAETIKCNPPDKNKPAFISADMDSRSLSELKRSIEQNMGGGFNLTGLFSDVFTVSKTGLSAVEITYFKHSS